MTSWAFFPWPDSISKRLLLKILCECKKICEKSKNKLSKALRDWKEMREKGGSKSLPSELAWYVGLWGYDILRRNYGRIKNCRRGIQHREADWRNMESSIKGPRGHKKCGSDLLAGFGLCSWCFAALLARLRTGTGSTTTTVEEVKLDTNNLSPLWSSCSSSWQSWALEPWSSPSWCPPSPPDRHSSPGPSGRRWRLAPVTWWWFENMSLCDLNHILYYILHI